MPDIKVQHDETVISIIGEICRVKVRLEAQPTQSVAIESGAVKVRSVSAQNGIIVSGSQIKVILNTFSGGGGGGVSGLVPIVDEEPDEDLYEIGQLIYNQSIPALQILLVSGWTTISGGGGETVDHAYLTEAGDIMVTETGDVMIFEP